LSKKIESIIFLVLLLFAGFVAVTQEGEVITPEFDYDLQEGEENIDDIILNPKEPARWFKSNAGGIAIKEINSRFIALRGDYALSIDSAYPDELPEFLLGFLKDEYHIEVRTLYERGAQIRTQWLFRDDDKNTRLNAVVLETDEENIIPAEEEGGEERVEIIYKRIGFVELFDDDLKIISEYSYYKDGTAGRIDFNYNETHLISAAFHTKKDNEGDEKYVKNFADFYRYNRSLSLRSIERVFYTDMLAKGDDIVRLSFPRNVRDSTEDDLYISERLNLYPEFFGDVFIKSHSRMVFDTDNRGRIQKQTLYDEEDKIIWVIINSWQNNRITLTTKTEGDLILSAEFQYNSAGDRISEKNMRNGTLERHVKTEGIMEIEELYMNNVIVLRAVWEDGRKISETRVR